MATKPIPSTYDSTTNLNLGQVPIGIQDPLVYDELMDIHNALETLLKGADSNILANRVIVSDSSTLAGDLLSNVEYFIDGIIDMQGESITVPSGGLHIVGYDFDTSKLISSTSSAVLFDSPVGGSGNLTIRSLAIEMSGTGAEVYNLVSVSGNEALELQEVNFNSCSSLGYIDNYRQGLEFDTGRFGGSPQLELIGAWTGGYRVSTSLVRGLDAGFTGSLFKAGTAFVMQSRFLTDFNVDLPATGNIFNFAPVNFPNPSTLELNACIITRNGVCMPEDATIHPNISAEDLSCSWVANQGVPNTYEGGTLILGSSASTSIASAGVFYLLAGFMTASDLQHFSVSFGQELINDGISPREFNVYGNFEISGTANDFISLRVRKTTSGSPITVFTTTRKIHNIGGSTDVAFFQFLVPLELDQGQHVFMEVANITAARNITSSSNNVFRVLRR